MSEWSEPIIDVLLAVFGGGKLDPAVDAQRTVLLTCEKVQAVLRKHLSLHDYPRLEPSLTGAQALRLVRAAMLDPRATRRCLMRQLGQAVRDRYRRHRSKKARNWPHQKTQRPPAGPEIRNASELEVQAAQRLREQKCTA